MNEVEHALPAGQPLTVSGPKRRQLLIVVCGPDMLDIPRPAPRTVHDLHRPRPDAVLTVRTYATTPETTTPA